VWDRCPRVGPVHVQEKRDVVDVSVDVPQGCSGQVANHMWVGTTVTLREPLGSRNIVNVGPDDRHDCD